MLTKLTTFVALTAVAQAVTVGKTVAGTQAAPTEYPKYATVIAATPAANTFGANGYACIRQAFNYGFPMTTTAGGAITVPNTTVDANVRAFFTTTTAQYGTNNSSGAAAGVVGQQSGCFTDGTTANSATMYGTSDALTPNRIRFQAGANYGVDVGAAIVINIDFVLASTYQDSYTGTGTRTAAPANYCDKQLHPLATAGATSTMTTTQGLKNTTKCSYFVTVAADKGAPAFKVTTLDYWKFQLHYAEWSATDLTGKYLAETTYTGKVVQANTFPTPLFNTYPASCTGAACINFIWPITGNYHANWWPQGQVSGSVGAFNAYAPQYATPFVGTATTQMDSRIFMNYLDAKIADNTSYNSAKTTYDSSKSTYNTALSNEKTRKADFFKSIFEAPVTIPTRPCPPTQPSAWTGATIDWDVASAAIATVNTTGKANQYGVFTDTAATTPSLAAGFLAATADSSITTPVAGNAGHVFGLRGQGSNTMPADGMAWASRAVVATVTHGMMVSLFPYDGTDTTGVAATKTVVITAQSVTWKAWKSFNAPTQPAAAVAPDSAAATYLAAGAAAVAAVAATLF